MATTTSRTGHDDVRGRRRHPAQVFDLLVGPVLILVGLLGFLASAAFDTGNPEGKDLIVFEVNGWHNLVHIASGALLVLGIHDWRRARFVTLVFGLTYGAVTIIGLVDGHDVLGLFPVDAADNVLHVVLTLLALAAATAPAPDGALHDRLTRTTPGEHPGDGARFGRDPQQGAGGATGDMTAPPTQPRR